MSVVIDGTSGVTTPGVVNTAGETIATTLAVTGASTLTGAVTASTTLAVTGVSTFAAGTALLPALTTTGDTNTGVWFPAADTIAASTGGTEQMRIDSAGLLKFNSGYGSAATAYGCRAWVNFNGTASGTFAGGASTVTRIAASTTATITTTTAHGLITGNTVYALTGVVAGAYTVTVLTTTTFTITTVATTALSAVSITFAVNSIRGSGNVSSITDRGTGLYTLNFTTAMPDANYSGVSSCTVGGAANVNRDSAVGPVNTTSAYCNSFDSSSGAGLDVDVICAAIFR